MAYTVHVVIHVTFARLDKNELLHCYITGSSKMNKTKLMSNKSKQKHEPLETFGYPTQETMHIIVL